MRYAENKMSGEDSNISKTIELKISLHRSNKDIEYRWYISDADQLGIDLLTDLR